MKNEDDKHCSAVSEQWPTHPRNSVYFMCQCCEEENPENAVCCREDIGIMPDGTWLCDDCYSDCEKTAYGLIANDIEDFEFPRFEDLPRPTPYIYSTARTEPQTAPPEACPKCQNTGGCHASKICELSGYPLVSRSQPFGYLLAKSGIDNGYYFVKPSEYNGYEPRDLHRLLPVYLTCSDAES